MERSEVLGRLRAQIAAGKPIIGGGAGTGITAKFAEAGGIDYAALAAALAEVLAPLLAGQRPVQFMLPTGDPEAAAMAAINRLVTV